MMMRVVINLLQNAIKYPPDGGAIKLSANRDGEAVLISVSDSGPGIPPHLQKQIFDKYSRIKYRDAPKGMGLGLAFCRLAVEAHQGRIWVESDGKLGSTFHFTLPAAHPTVEANPSQLATA
jgi:signal transduction histidine kinase